MEFVAHDFDTRRVFERRQNDSTPPSNERRVAERRISMDRREPDDSLSGWLRWRLFTLPILIPISTKSRRKIISSHIPRWLPLSFFALVFVVLVSTYGQVSPFVTSDMAVTAPVNDMEAEEVIIIDPTDIMTLTLVGEGYQVLETLDMEELGLVVQRLQLPAGISIPEALTNLRVRYPNHDIDTNQSLGLLE